MVETAVEFDYETEREIIAIEEQLKRNRAIAQPQPQDAGDRQNQIDPGAPAQQRTAL